MIVQSAARGEPHFVIAMRDHTLFAGQFARAFGNERFEPVAPRDVVIDLVENHDRGWDEWDAAAEADPLTRLPYSLARTPMETVLRTNVGSPDFNEERHAYAGLLSSMHTTGLYNGRFGYSDHIVIDKIADEWRPGVDAMLEGERRRGERLTERLAADAETRPWVADRHKFQNYKQLQFFDTLALYFNMNHANERSTASFQHVPLNAGEDITVTIAPVGDRRYSLRPYPFAADPLELSFRGRHMTPMAADDQRRAAEILDEIPYGEETVTLTAG